MSRRNKKHREIPAALRVPPADQLLIDDLPTIDEQRILCTTLGRGQFAAEASRRNPGARIVLHVFDAYLADESRRFLADKAADALEQGRAGEEEQGPPSLPIVENLEVVCAADFPETEFDLVALTVDPRGEAELTRELLQTAHERLRIGGRLLSATSNDEDQWLHDELRKLFPKVTRCPTEKKGVLYRAVKTAPLKKLKHYDCEFAFRDGERLIQGVSRPGVFNHRNLDAGARALINTMQIADGARVLDIGCGSGAVAFAAAFRGENVAVVAIDSNARAIECTERGAVLNGLTNITTILDANGETGAPGTFDLVAGNPPYFSDYRISEIFLQAARRALKPGGTVLIVTKALAWYEERMPELFDEVKRLPHKLYTVLEGRNPEGS